VSRLGEAFQRIGGPGAVTWWAFGVSLVDRLLTVSVQPINVGAPLSARVLATVLAQLAMFAPLVLLRFTLLRDPLRPRPWIALAGFVIADIVRAIAVDRLLHDLGGLPLMPALRIFSGFLPTLIPLVVTAYVVNSVRERQRRLTELMEVQAELEMSRLAAAKAAQFRNDELVGRARSVMEAELAGISGEQPAAVVAQLQRTASDVVRPLSHELARSFAAREGPEPERPRVQVGWQQVVGDASVDRPFLPLATTAVLSAILLSAAATFPAVRWQLPLMLLVVPLVLAGANALLRLALPRLRPLGRLSLVVAAGVVSGAMVGTVLWALARGWSSAVAIAVALSFYVALVGISLALVNGMLAARSALLADTAAALEQLRRQVVRTRQLTWFQQRMVARALHGPVQMAVTAAAIRLDSAIRNDDVTPGLTDQIRAELLTTLDVLNEPDGSVVSFEQGLERMRSTWEGVCVIGDDVSRAAAQIIAKDGVLRSIVIDIVSEAVSNAVWHGHATTATIRLDVADEKSDELLVEVTADSRGIEEPKRRGLGTQLLDECTLNWRRASSAEGDALTATLPC
jgi:signal transduction histidine kinase